MIAASDLRAGMAVRYQNQAYRVLAADYHPGQGKMGGVNHVRLQNLATGTFWENSFRSDLKLETLPVERHTLQFLYDDDGNCVFMNPESCEQVEVAAQIIGPPAKFLEPGMLLPIEFVEGHAVAALFPDVIDVKIAATAPPIHGQAEANWKTAKLENGVAVLVPPFVKSGDSIRLNVTELKYMDRSKARAGTL